MDFKIVDRMPPMRCMKCRGELLRMTGHAIVSGFVLDEASNSRKKRFMIDTVNAA